MYNAILDIGRYSRKMAGTQGKMADMFSDLAKTFSIGSASESFKLKAVFGLSQRFIF